MKFLTKFITIFLIISFPITASAANRKGSHRIGGTNSHGKGSHYVGGRR